MPCFDDILRDIEGLLFAAGEPLTAESITMALRVRGDIAVETVLRALSQLELKYCVDGKHGFEVARVAGGWCMRTNRRCEDVLASLFDVTEQTKLSQAAYETLAIIAYLQPVTRRQIAEIRGVNSDSALRTLLERELVREVGRSEGPGQAVLYGTSERFLLVFGLRGLQDLPPLEAFDVTEEEKEELIRRLGALSAP